MMYLLLSAVAVLVCYFNGSYCFLWIPGSAMPCTCGLI